METLNNDPDKKVLKNEEGQEVVVYVSESGVTLLPVASPPQETSKPNEEPATAG